MKLGAVIEVLEDLVGRQSRKRKCCSGSWNVIKILM